MKPIRKFNTLLQFGANLLMFSFLLGLIALPSLSIGIIKLNNNTDSNGNVLSAQDVKLKVDPNEIKTGKYFFNEDTGKIELKTTEQNYHKSVIQELIELTETTESTNYTVERSDYDLE